MSPIPIPTPTPTPILTPVPGPDPQVFTPYTKGVSATMMRNSRALRMRLLPNALADSLLDVHETHVYQPLRKGLEKVATASSTLRPAPSPTLMIRVAYHSSLTQPDQGLLITQPSPNLHPSPRPSPHLTPTSPPPHPTTL